MKRLAIFFAIILFFLTSLPVQQSVSAKDNWISVRSKNFFLLGNGSEKQIRQVGTRLEQFREVFSKLFTRMKVTSPVPATVIVFKSDKSYAPFKSNPNLAGYFQPGPDVNYITLTDETRGSQDPFNVIFHEYTHLLINNNIPNVPIWFNEGLAEYYSNVKVIDDQKFEVGSPISSHVYLLREKKMIPLRTLFKIDHKSPEYNERDKQSVFYAESWALMHYLILGNNAQRVKQIGKFVDGLAANIPMETAFQKAFGTTIEQMEKELREYVKNDRYNVLTGQFNEKIGFDKEMQSAPVSEAEAQAYLGDLLLHSHRAEAESYLKKALELDPNLAMAHASLGMLRVREHKTAEARESLERAVAASSQNYLIHYYYAYALSRESAGDSDIVTGFAPQNLEKMRSHLQQAIELRPDFPESYSLMAYVNLVSGTKLDETVVFLKRALSAAPNRNDLNFMLAQIYLRKDDYKTAHELLQKLSENNSDAELKQRAQTMLAQVIAMEEQRTNGSHPRRDSGSNATSQEPIISVDQTGVTENRDPSSYLREALRKPETGETQIQGRLMQIDCDAKGITFVVQVGGETLKLTTASFDNVDLTSFTPDAGNEIKCGPRKPENNVILNYVPVAAARGKANGVAKSIEFVPNDFKLKATP